MEQEIRNKKFYEKANELNFLLLYCSVSNRNVNGKYSVPFHLYWLILISITDIYCNLFHL